MITHIKKHLCGGFYVMKVLAVIPARAGSKGIPNKNIRIINGHPLIYYAIHNAQESGYITDIVVTTDSKAVGIIASQMGVRVHWRSEALCGDAVTLDAVVADAVPKNEQWDYIVTMQPTSPTLKYETLDRAIEYSVNQHLDTLISVINAPHLTWGIHNGMISPNYEKRLNRQYLPPCYYETGAFVISSASVVTPETRIGKTVGVFEIPENESQDVDNFDDLRSVEATLSSKTVAIYVNADNKHGFKRINHALELADEFFVKPDIYYDVNQTDSALFGDTTHRLFPIDGIEELLENCRERGYSVFINDIPETSSDYMSALRSALPNAKVVNFDDNGDGCKKADLVINAFDERSIFSNVLTGWQYYICSKTFLFYQPIMIKEHVEHIIIDFGESVSKDLADKILAIISKSEFASYKFTVIVGYTQQDEDKSLISKGFSNIEMVYDVDRIPEIMHDCDVAITTSELLGYDSAILGIPTIFISQLESQNSQVFVTNKNGFSRINQELPGEMIEENIKEYLFASKEKRQQIQNVMLQHDLRGGRKKVTSLLNNL